jgi:multidrug transporter EmrE-like cation transporter
MLSLAALAATIICSAGGNVLARWSLDLGGRARLASLASAGSVHALGLVCFSVALAGIPLAIAYPALIGGSIAFVSLFAVIIFKEPLPGRHISGLILVIFGMLLLLQDFGGH